jgi:type II secretory pathway pseudopilin PulG
MCMTEVGPTSPRPTERPESPAAVEVAEQEPSGATSPAVERANRMSAANMIRSLAPLVVICLLLVAWQAFRASNEETVRTVDATGTVQLAVERAGYEVQAPSGLPEDYRTTSARTDAGFADEGAPVTLEIGYLTPSGEFAGFTVSDDAGARPVRAAIEGSTDEGTVDVDGEPWTRLTTERGETALTREDGEVVLVVTGSATDDELREVAAAVGPAEG